MTLAYHFVSDTLRDGRPIPADGEWLEHAGPIRICETGLHASRHVADALRYANARASLKSTTTKSCAGVAASELGHAIA